MPIYKSRKLKMTENEKIQYLKAIDFGELDANADPKLEIYFVDDNYWDRIIKHPIYFVIGKKGTGKSAIYQYLQKKSIEEGTIIANKDFADFPSERLTDLADNNFAKPNQYQSLWQHVILDIFIDLIMHNQNADTSGIYYKELKSYYDVCIGDSINLHKEVLSSLKKVGHSLELTALGITPSISQENEITKQIGSWDRNISAINSRLLNILYQYFLSREDNSSYIIQFDRLDDTYNQYSDIENYYHLIISLMKTVYSVNNKFRIAGLDNIKVIVYLRSDIIREIGKFDSESARWDDYTFIINWAVLNQNDWRNSALLKMINKRISTSLGKDISFYDLFNKQAINLHIGGITGAKQDVFKYIVDKTFHRPRDIIQFCKYIQKEVSETIDIRKINFRNIKNAEKSYTYWLVSSELSNEMNPIIKDIDLLFELLKSLGKRPFSFTTFKTNYDTIIGNSDMMNPDKLIEYLYDVGIILNVSRDRNGTLLFRSIIRNNGKVNKNMQLMIHQGVWIGLLS